MKYEHYQTFTDQLTANLQADDRVQGLAVFGSTANQSHPPDEWSDHDFFVITKSGVQEHFRTHFDWLPDHESIVLTVRETRHGLKVLYANGHLIEFAVFDLDEMTVARFNDYAVLYDRGGVADTLARMAAQQTVPTYTADQMQRDLGMMPCLLLVGAGRVARGEAISGQVFIRTYALSHLLPLLTHTLTAPDTSRLDNLDSFRRFEQVFPEVGAEINAALGEDPIGAALGLLDIYERVLHGVEGYPAEAVTTTRQFLQGLPG